LFFYQPSAIIGWGSRESVLLGGLTAVYISFSLAGVASASVCGTPGLRGLVKLSVEAAPALRLAEFPALAEVSVVCAGHLGALRLRGRIVDLAVDAAAARCDLAVFFALAKAGVVFAVHLITLSLGDGIGHLAIDAAASLRLTAFPAHVNVSVVCAIHLGTLGLGGWI
jgi:hypothetical protein